MSDAHAEASAETVRVVVRFRPARKTPGDDKKAGDDDKAGPPAIGSGSGPHHAPSPSVGGVPIGAQCNAFVAERATVSRTPRFAVWRSWWTELHARDERVQRALSWCHLAQRGCRRRRCRCVTCLACPSIRSELCIGDADDGTDSVKRRGSVIGGEALPPALLLLKGEFRTARRARDCDLCARLQTNPM